MRRKTNRFPDNNELEVIAGFEIGGLGVQK
jgi:hypothetical protein